MRGKARCRLHGGKSTGARTKAGIQKIRAAHWVDGRRSARLLTKAKAWSELETQKGLLELLEDWTPVTIRMRRLMGLPDLPRYRCRVRLKCPDGPPKEWADGTSSVRDELAS